MPSLAWSQRELQQVNVWDGPQRKGRTSSRTHWVRWLDRRQRLEPPRNTIEIQVTLRRSEAPLRLEMSSVESSRRGQGKHYNSTWLSSFQLILP